MDFASRRQAAKQSVMAYCKGLEVLFFNIRVLLNRLRRRCAPCKVQVLLNIRVSLNGLRRPFTPRKVLFSFRRLCYGLVLVPQQKDLRVFIVLYCFPVLVAFIDHEADLSVDVFFRSFGLADKVFPVDRVSYEYKIDYFAVFSFCKIAGDKYHLYITKSVYYLVYYMIEPYIGEDKIVDMAKEGMLGVRFEHLFVTRSGGSQQPRFLEPVQLETDSVAGFTELTFKSA